MALVWTDIAEPKDHASFGSFQGGYATVGGREGMNSYLRPLNVAEEDDGITVGASFNSSNGGLDRLFELESDDGSFVQMILQVYPPTRKYRIWRGKPESGGTIIGESDPNMVPFGVWTHLEMKVKIADSGGSVELRREETTIILATGIDTRFGGTDALIDRVGFARNGFGENNFSICTDIHIITEGGASPTSFVGHHRGYWLDPTSQGNYNEQPGSDGNSTDTHLLVDELGTPNDADYYGSATDGARQTFGMRDLTPTVGTVLSMMVRARNIKTDAGAKKLRSLIRRSSTDVAGADWIVDVAADSDYTLYPTDPVAAAAWTVTTINDTEVGTEVRP